MEKSETLLKLWRSLLSIDAFVMEESSCFFDNFENRHCYSKTLQPMFSASALSLLTDHMNEEVFYEITDKLGIHLIFFRYMNRTYFIGPFVRRYFDERGLQAILIQNNFPISHMTAIRLKYTNYPLLDSSDIYRTILSCINVIYDAYPEFTYRTLYGFENEKKENFADIRESIDYSDIYARYENENKLLEAIRKGDEAHILSYYDKMQQLPKEYIESYINNAAYQSPYALIRALARKAAEAGGLPVVVIDELTQSQVQQEKENRRKGITDDSMPLLLKQLTAAVAEQQKKTAGCSPAVISVINFIALNYSQNLTKEQLANVSGYSVSHLARLFKSETDMSLSEYILKCRCRKAAELLESTDLTVGEIGALVGYEDNNYFTKRFKQFCQMTPSEYRCSKRTAL